MLYMYKVLLEGNCTYTRQASKSVARGGGGGGGGGL